MNQVIVAGGLALIFHVMVPLAFVIWLAFSRAKNRLYWLLLAWFVGAFLVVLVNGGAAWSWFGHFWRYAFPLCYLFAIVWFGYQKFTVLPWLPGNEKRTRQWVNISLVALLAFFFTASTRTVLTARTYTGDALELTFPLRGGVFHIGHGGANEGMNYHYRNRAQRYALDIVMLNQFGARNRSLSICARSLCHLGD